MTKKTCQRMCPAAETALYSHRNPGEDMAQAVSNSGRNYSELPTAFAYRKQFNPACMCKPPGMTWAETLKGFEDQTVERGDIVVNEERARQLSLPPELQKQQPRQPARPAATAKGTAPATASAAPAPQPDSAVDADPPRRTTRPVNPAGPTYSAPR